MLTLIKFFDGISDKRKSILINRKTQELQFYVFARLFINLIRTKLNVKYCTCCTVPVCSTNNNKFLQFQLFALTLLNYIVKGIRLVSNI